MQHRLQFKKNIRDRFVTEVAYALNLLIEFNPSVKYIADIDKIDVKTLHSALEKQVYEDNGFKLFNFKNHDYILPHEILDRVFNERYT
ncbi:MAG: hypothetical protein MJA31_10025 [Clostridia bacterium]|nr:hypothetical protein [Clostridia bacterium]